MGNVKIRIAFQQRQTEHNRLANIDGSLTLYDFFPAYNKQSSWQAFFPSRCLPRKTSSPLFLLRLLLSFLLGHSKYVLCVPQLSLRVFLPSSFVANLHFLLLLLLLLFLLLLFHSISRWFHPRFKTPAFRTMLRAKSNEKLKKKEKKKELKPQHHG